MINLVKINKDNIDLAFKIENEIFPEYNAYNNYLGSLNADSKTIFFIIYNDLIPIGVSGLYWYRNDNKSAWLGFFGLKEEYRGKRFGNEALMLTEDYAKKLGFKYMRLFTDDINYKAINFYKLNGYIFEDYNSNLEELKDEFKVVIGSKSISDLEMELWNNRFINLTKQTLKQK